MHFFRDYQPVSGLALKDLPGKDHRPFCRFGGILRFEFLQDPLRIIHYRHGDENVQRTLKLWFHEIHRHLRLPAPDLSDHTNEQGMVHGVSSQYSEDEKRWLVTDFVLHPFRLMLNSQALKRFSLPNLPLPGGKTFRTRPAKTDLIVRNDELALQLEMIHPGHQPTLVEPDHLGWALELLRQLEITPLQTDAVRGEILFASEAEFEIAEKFLSLHAENILPL